MSRRKVKISLGVIKLNENYDYNDDDGNGGDYTASCNLP